MKTGEDRTGKKANQGIFNSTVIIISAVISISLGILLIFFPEVKVNSICTGLEILVLVVGISMIIKYFLLKAYENQNEYGFSKGIFLIIISICGLIQNQLVVGAFLFYLGIWILISSVIKLQYAMDLISMKDKKGKILLIVSFIMAVLAGIIIMNYQKESQFLKMLTYGILIFDGVLSILCNLYLFIKIKKKAVEENKKIDSKEENKTLQGDRTEEEKNG